MTSPPRGPRRCAHGRFRACRNPRVQRAQRDHHMTERVADRAHRGAVTQIALPARDRQLDRQMLKHRIGQTQIAFGVLEVDGIDFVRHYRRTDLARHQLLRKIAERDITPYITRKAEQNRANPRYRVEHFSEKIVTLDLRGQRIPDQAETFDEAPRMRQSNQLQDRQTDARSGCRRRRWPCQDILAAATA